MDTDPHDSVRDRAIETASHDEAYQLSDQAWRAFISDIAVRSPFYQHKFSQSGIETAEVTNLADVSLLPFTTKDEIRQTQEEHPPFGLHLGTDAAKVKCIYQTSGSSGTPCVIALTDADKETWTTIGTRTYWATGIRPHHSVLTTFGAGPFVAGQTHSTFDRIGARRVPVQPGDTDRFISASQRGLVDTLLSTPSFALHLCSVIENMNLDGPSLGVRRIVVGGEPGGGIPSIRSLLQETFAASVVEACGVGDIAPSLWGECQMKEGMHFCGQGLVWPELIDPDTGALIPVEPGAKGEIVYTTLVREAMPLIRFRSRDIVQVDPTPCPCGRTSFRIRILGRSDDMIIVRGVNVYPTAIQSIVAEFQPVVTGRCRVILTTDDVSVEPPVPVEVEINDGSSAPSHLVSEIEDAIRNRLTFRARVSLIRSSEFGDPGYKTQATRKTS